MCKTFKTMKLLRKSKKIKNSELHMFILNVTNIKMPGLLKLTCKFI